VSDRVRIPSFDEQILIWGYAIVGSDVLQQDAQEAEHDSGIAWDMDAQWLSHIERRIAGKKARVPEWYCLVHLPISWREQATEALMVTT